MKNEKQKGFSSLHDLLAAIPRTRVVVAGDVMLDRFVYGDVHRISPESPVPVLTIAREEDMPGGAGNVAANLAGLGASCRILAVAGADGAGAALRALLEERTGAVCDFVTDSARPTTVKSRFLAQHQQLLRTDFEQARPLPPALREELLAKADAVLNEADALVLSDYGKGVLADGVAAALIGMAARLGIPVLVDPKGSDYGIYRGASVVTPNRKELSEATGGMPAKSDAEVTAAARALIDRAGIGAVIATRSQDGMSVIEPGRDPVHLRTEALEVFDVSGAGDTVIATAAAALAAGASLTEAAALANAAGGIVVAKVGTAPVRAQELGARLDARETGLRAGDGAAVVADSVREAPVCGFDEACERVRRWQARGLRVGFTNGCFDLLHYGHASYLNRARDLCDRLVVGLNADESVRRLKGDGRPVNAERARAGVLGALGSVDMVVPFGADPADGDEPCRLVGLLRPDIYFKGGDYSESRLPEAAVVKSYGGQVRIMDLYEGHSTTGTIEKMKGKKPGGRAA